MGKFIAKKGDRVLYTGTSRPDWHGNPATVVRVTDTGHVTMRFDRPHSGGSYKGTGFMLNDLVPLVPGVDVTKPLRFKEDDRKVVLVGTMPNGDIVATSLYNSGEPWAFPSVFNAATGEDRDGESGLMIENAPVVRSGFHALAGARHGPYERGFTSLNFVWSDYPEAVGAVEIIYEDDRPIDAKFHARP